MNKHYFNIANIAVEFLISNDVVLGLLSNISKFLDRIDVFSQQLQEINFWKHNLSKSINIFMYVVFLENDQWYTVYGFIWSDVLKIKLHNY